MYAVLFCFALIACSAYCELGIEPVCLSEYIKPSRDYDIFKEHTEFAWLCSNFGVVNNPQNLTLCHERYGVFQKMITMECNEEYTELLCETYLRTAKDCMFPLPYGGGNSTIYAIEQWIDYHNGMSMELCAPQFDFEITFVSVGVWATYVFWVVVLTAILLSWAMSSISGHKRINDSFFYVCLIFLYFSWMDSALVTSRLNNIFCFVQACFIVLCIYEHFCLKAKKKDSPAQVPEVEKTESTQSVEILEQTKLPVDALQLVESSIV